MHSKILCGLACWLAQAASAAVSESDYLADVPTVISVSRLAQTLDDTPGAVTILDRHFIRMTGARDVVDVLRFVPGFQTTSSFETDAPMATYHGRNDDWANRIQVLVDGRSVYSGLQQGSAGIGWQSLSLDDIERIEVLRGSNSASYGARAFLGVVNIISRDVRETQGAAASVARGENGIADAGARFGWSTHAASFRLSADSVSDEGLQGAFGANHTERLNLSSHFSLDQGAELALRAGGVGIDAGRGSKSVEQYGNPMRRWSLGSQFVQADWHAPLSDVQDLSFSASHTENYSRDRFAYLEPGHPFYGATVDFGGDEYVDTLTAQHTVRLSPALRMVWGGEFRRETVVAPPLFEQTEGISTDFYRLFGSAEWRVTDTLLLNAGALAEHSAADGGTLSPRLMLNWHLLPGHTLRAGASTAFRPPSTYERSARVQYHDPSGQQSTGYFTLNDGSLRPERLVSRELGYYFAPVGTALSGDVRIFEEQISQGIAHTEGTIIPGVQPQTYLNIQNNQISGLEWQLQWQAGAATRFFFAQNWTQIDVASAPGVESRFRTTHGAPRYTASLSAMHSFEGGWHLSVLHNQADDVALMSISDNQRLFSMRRTDLRLAKDLRLAGQKAELALVVQNMDNPYQDGDHKYYFNRRALLTLRIEN